MLTMYSHRSGHVCNFEIKNGKVRIYDGQPNKEHSFTKLIQRGIISFDAARIDNVEINPSLIGKLVKRSGT